MLNKVKREWGELIVLGAIIVAISLLLHIFLAWINPRDIFTDCRVEKSEIVWLKRDKASLQRQVGAEKTIAQGLISLIRDNEREILKMSAKTNKTEAR